MVDWRLSVCDSWSHTDGDAMKNVLEILHVSREHGRSMIWWKVWIS